MARVRGGMAPFDPTGAGGVGRGVNVHENRYGTAIGDRFGRGQKSIRAGDHFVVDLNAERQKSQMKRGGSGAEPDAVLGPAEIGKLPLEGLDFFSKDKRRIL